MKMSHALTVLVLSLGLAALDADAKRLGGGGNIGKQRPSPTMSEAQKAPPAAAPAAPAQAAPAPAPVTPPVQPSFMSRWGGMLAGLGIGALLGSMFGGGLGSGMAGVLGLMLVLLLVGAIAFALYRMFASRRDTGTQPVQFAGIGSAVSPPQTVNLGGSASAPEQARQSAAVCLPPGFETAPFLRVAKTSFIRLQAANDAKDLDDIRDYTTPEMYAELEMQIRERGDAPQRTEVVTLDAQLAEAVVEGDYAMASVRFSGLIREQAEGNPEPFDEVWHVRKSLKDSKATWLIAGIQQAA
jgi:predicted lipid-binding transport protein (Tim44 family)